MDDGLPQVELARTTRALPFALIRAREALLVPLRRMLAEAGVSEPQWRILRVLAEAGPMSGQGLARAACLQPASVSRILQSMLERELIARVQNPLNRRRQVVSICPEGLRLLSEYSAMSRGITDRFEQRFGAEKYRLLLDLLEEFNSLPPEEETPTS